MRAFPFTASGVIGPAVSASGGFTRLRGVIVTEVAGTPALVRVNIREATSSGAILLPIKCAASSTVVVDFNEPVSVNGAVYVELVTGASTAVGSVLVD